MYQGEKCSSENFEDRTKFLGEPFEKVLAAAAANFLGPV